MGDSWWTPLVAPAALAALALLALLWAALPGRRVNDHPVCRRCGFDLFGKPANSHRCAECGADLRRRRAVRVGRRRTRGRRLAFALLLVLATTVWGGVAGRRVAAKPQAVWYKPRWWLVLEARHAAPARRDLALAELTRRITSNLLPRRAVDSLADEALDVQADLNKPWSPAWGLLIEAARSSGRLTDERWGRYARQAVAFRFTVRPVARADRPLPYDLSPLPPRGGAVPFELRYQAWMSCGDAAAPESRRKVAGVCTLSKGAWAPVRHSAFVTGRGSDWLDEAGLSPGPQTARASVAAAVYEPGKAAPLRYSLNWPTPGDPTAALAVVSARFDVGWTLLPPTAPPTRLNTNPDLAPVMRQAVRLTARPQRTEKSVRFELEVKRPPIALAHQLWLRHARTEVCAGPLLARPGESTRKQIVINLLADDPAASGPVELVLRPDQELPTPLADVAEIWGGEIVLWSGVLSAPAKDGTNNSDAGGSLASKADTTGTKTR